MADILKVSTPTAGYETNTRTNPITTNDKNIQNIIDPSKITRADSNQGYMNNPENRFALTSESNFEKFVQLLKNTPSLSETLTQMLFTGMGTVVTSGISEDFAAEISKFMNMLKMTDGELLQFIKDQSNSSVRFKGEFFAVLYQALEQTNSVDLKTDILNFLKKYNDLASNSHVFENIMQNLKDMAKSMPKSYREPLEQLMKNLDMNAKNGDTAKNAGVLKNEILPYLSKYIGRTHDLGKVRDMITLLSMNIARYENGSSEKFMAEFQSLLGYQSVKEKLSAIDSKHIETLLLNMEFGKDNAVKNANLALIDKLISIISKGVEGEAGYEGRAVFENIMHSLLINESVYMPLIHMIIPADIDGRVFFSEMWIDPNNENSNETSEDEKSIKIFVKFDIKDVGFFDLIVTSQKEIIDLQLYYPEKLSPMEKNIKNGINGIVEKNGFSFRSFYIDKCIKPKTITEVFPKIYERKNAINVSI